LPVVKLEWVDSKSNSRSCDEAVLCRSYIHAKGDRMITNFVVLEEWIIDEEQAIMKTASSIYGEIVWTSAVE
jgi:hypothetical protein